MHDSEGGYYEVECIIDRRVNPLTQVFEYLVRFKGYSASDDMWLPASSFNMPVDYVSVSSYGKKRQSCTNFDESVDEKSSGVAKRRLTKSSTQTLQIHPRSLKIEMPIPLKKYHSVRRVHKKTHTLINIPKS